MNIIRNRKSTLQWDGKWCNDKMYTICQNVHY